MIDFTGPLDIARAFYLHGWSTGSWVAINSTIVLIGALVVLSGMMRR